MVLRALALLCGVSSLALGQQADTLAAKRELPALEIPELTIVGKKAITLPFARKGEIYDVNVYEAAAADSGLLLDRLQPSIPVGSLPRYEQRQMPWRSSLEGSFGSFSTVDLHGYLDYSSERWGIAGKGSYARTSGHTDNSAGTTALAGATIHSLLATDNDVLRTLRASFGASVQHDSYGRMGGSGSTLERKRDNIVIDGRLGSLNRQGVVLDMNLGANIWKVSDQFAAADSSVTVVSPEVGASLATDIGAGRLLGEFSFISSSLDYQHPTESPSLLSVAGSVRWFIASRVSLQAGGRYAGGSNSEGGSRSLFAPLARVTWEIDDGRSIALWFEPRMTLESYDEHVRLNPYLVRELSLQPERQILRFGSTFWYNRGIVTMELRAAFTKSSGKDLVVADSAGLRLEPADVFQTEITAEGTVRPSPATRVRFAGTIQPSFEDGTTTQLAMTPAVKLSARGELDLLADATVWSLLEYRSKQNTDRSGSRSLGDVALLGVGATASMFTHAVLSFEARNLLNSSYSWWEGFPAPGRSFTIGAKLRIQ
jgi:hypothetical protein